MTISAAAKKAPFSKTTTTRMMTARLSLNVRGDGGGDSDVFVSMQHQCVPVDPKMYPNCVLRRQSLPLLDRRRPLGLR